MVSIILFTSCAQPRFVPHLPFRSQYQAYSMQGYKSMLHQLATATSHNDVARVNRISKVVHNHFTQFVDTRARLTSKEKKLLLDQFESLRHADHLKGPLAQGFLQYFIIYFSKDTDSHKKKRFNKLVKTMKQWLTLSPENVPNVEAFKDAALTFLHTFEHLLVKRLLLSHLMYLYKKIGPKALLGGAGALTALAVAVLHGKRIAGLAQEKVARLVQEQERDPLKIVEEVSASGAVPLTAIQVGLGAQKAKGEEIAELQQEIAELNKQIEAEGSQQDRRRLVKKKKIAEQQLFALERPQEFIKQVSIQEIVAREGEIKQFVRDNQLVIDNFIQENADNLIWIVETYPAIKEQIQKGLSKESPFVGWLHKKTSGSKHSWLIQNSKKIRKKIINGILDFNFADLDKVEITEQQKEEAKGFFRKLFRLKAKKKKNPGTE